MGGALQILVPIMGALRALVEAWGAWCQDPDWTDEPLVDEDDESVEFLVELLRKSEQGLRLEVGAVLYHLCTHEYDLMVRAGEIGAISELVDVVKNNMQSAAVVWAVSGLCVLVTHEPHQERFAAVDGHVAMVNVLQTTQHSDVAEQAARTLSNFMCGHKAQLQVEAAGGAQAMVSVLSKCMRGQLVQVESLMQQVCAAICNLTFENDANRIKVGQVGGCDVLVYVCKLSPSYQVLEQACAAIGNICKKNRTNRSLMGSVGCCEMLLSVLSLSPPERTAVQAVRAIGNVAMRAPENQLKFAAGNGLRLLLQLIETLSLRLAPVEQQVCMEHNLSAQNRRGASPASGGSQYNTPRGGDKNQTQHQESFLQLTLSALAALVVHECCRAQLQSDVATMELLQRIARIALWPETVSVANRLVVALSMQPTPEEPAPPAAKSAGVYTSTIEVDKEQGGDATAQGLVAATPLVAAIPHLPAAGKHEVPSGASQPVQPSQEAPVDVTTVLHRSSMAKGEWDPSDTEGGEDDILDHHSDACSVRSNNSHYSRMSRRSSTSRRSSVYSRGSSISSRPGSMASSLRTSLKSHEDGDEDGMSQVTRSQRSSRGSLLSDGDSFASESHMSALSRRSSYASLFSDASASDDELDVEPPELGRVKSRVKSKRASTSSRNPSVDTAAQSGGIASSTHIDVLGWKRSSLGSHTSSHSLHDLEADSMAGDACCNKPQSCASGGSTGSAPSSLDNLIVMQTLRLSIDSLPTSEAAGVGAQVRCWHGGGGLGAIPASPMSADGLTGLPAMLLSAMKDRHHPNDDEASAIWTWKQKQRVVDAWLTVAEALQSQQAALNDLELRCKTRLWRAAFFEWRCLLDEARSCGGGDSDTEERDDLHTLDSGDHRAQDARLELIVQGAGGSSERAPAHLSRVLGASMPSSPAGDSRSINWDLVQRNQSCDSMSNLSFGSAERNRTSSCFAEQSRQSICSEESFCCDTRSAPSLPSLPLGCKDGMSSSVDLMTVASEASTRSLGSEQSNMSWFEGASSLSLQHKMPEKLDSVPPFPGTRSADSHLETKFVESSGSARSAEAQLEASTREYMESLLNYTNTDTVPIVCAKPCTEDTPPTVSTTSAVES